MIWKGDVAGDPPNAGQTEYRESKRLKSLVFASMGGVLHASRCDVKK